MRVLHVIPTLSPLDGGTTVSVLDMARGQERLGAEVTIVTTTGHGKGDFDRSDGEVVESEGIRTIYFHRRWPRSWKYSPSMARWLRASVHRFDVLHTHSLFCYPEIPAVLSANAEGVPVVLSPAGMHDAWSLSHRGWKKWPYYQLVERKTLNKVDALHVTAESEKAGFADTPYYEKCVVIPLGIQIDSSEPDDLHDADNLKQNDGRLNLLFLARIHPKKGLPILLRSLNRLVASGMEIHLTIAGEGEEGYVAEMRALCRELAIEHRVRFAGFLEGDAKRRAFLSSDIYVLPSYQENFGISVAEAMSLGLPVVITDQVGISDEVARAGAGVVIPPDSEDALVEAVGRLSDKEYRKQLGQAGKSFAASRYSNAAQAGKILDLYRRLINDKATG